MCKTLFMNFGFPAKDNGMDPTLIRWGQFTK